MLNTKSYTSKNMEATEFIVVFHFFAIDLTFKSGSRKLNWTDFDGGMMVSAKQITILLNICREGSEVVPDNGGMVLTREVVCVGYRGQGG